MEKVSMFANGLDFASKAAKLGTKVTNSTRPELSRDYTKDKFTLNDKARRALGVQTGKDRVCLIDMENHVEIAEGQTARFFIHKGYKEGDSIVGNKIGRDGGISSAIHWTSCLLNQDGEVGCKSEDLVRLGLASFNIAEESGKSYLTANSKTLFGLVSVGVHPVAKDENQEVIAEAELFALVEPVTINRADDKDAE
jgi:hypothetical protein